VFNFKIYTATENRNNDINIKNLVSHYHRAVILIAALHNHFLYLKISNPDLVSSYLSSGPSPPSINSPCIYSVTSKSKGGVHTVEQEFVNYPKGVDTHVSIQLPVGGTMTIRAKWRVIDGILKEEVEIKARYLVQKIARGPMEKIVSEQHKTFFVEAEKAEKV
jgi:hypothetical protein